MSQPDLKIQKVPKLIIKKVKNSYLHVPQLPRDRMILADRVIFKNGLVRVYLEELNGYIILPNTQYEV